MPHRHRVRSASCNAFSDDDTPTAITAAPHDIAEQLGSQPPESGGPPASFEDLAVRFLNEAVESDFPERLASEEHDRELDDSAMSDEPEAWDAQDLERILRSGRSMSRLIQESWDTALMAAPKPHVTRGR